MSTALDSSADSQLTDSPTGVQDAPSAREEGSDESSPHEDFKKVTMVNTSEIETQEVPVEWSDTLSPSGRPRKRETYVVMFGKLQDEDKCGFADYELSDLAYAFQLFDILGDRVLTAQGVFRALEQSGYPQPYEDFLKVANIVDPEGENYFDFKRFVELCSYFKRPPLTEVEVKETFELMDRDQSGSIDAWELKQLVGCVGHALTLEESEAMVADADKDGEIDFAEFVVNMP